MVVDYFVDDHRLYLGVGRPVKCADLLWDELTDIRIVFVLLVSQIMIDVGSAMGMGSSFGFHNILIELDFRRSTLERHRESQLVDIRRRIASSLSDTAGPS